MRFQCRIGPFEENQGEVALSAPALGVQPSAHREPTPRGRKPPAHHAVFAAVLIAAAGCATPDPRVAKTWKFEPVLTVNHSVPPSQAYYSIGRHHDAARAWDKSIEAYGKAVAADAGNVEARNALGVALAQAGRHAEAEAALREALAATPGRAHLRSNLGYVLLLAGKPGEAVVELKAAVSLDAANSTARANLRTALAQVDDGQYSQTAPDAASGSRPILSAAATTRSESVVEVHTDAAPAVAPTPTTINVLAPIAVAVLPAPLPSSIGVPAPLQTASIPAPTTVAAYASPTPVTVRDAPSAMHVVDRPTVSSLEEPPAFTLVLVQAQQRAAVTSSPLPAPPSVSSATSARPPAMRLEVSNGNGVTGMAARVGRWLATQGLQTDRLTNQQPFVQQQTVVQYRAGYEETAVRVARSLPANARADSAPTQGLRSDVRVVLGRDLMRTAACVSTDSCEPASTTLAFAESAGH